VRDWRVVVDSPVFAALVAGLYVSVFYIMTNLTMLPFSSVLLVALVVIAPLVAAVTLLCLLLYLLGAGAYAKPVSIFVCVVYILVFMQQPLMGIRTIDEFIGQLDDTTITALKILCLVVPAALLGYVFRHNVVKFSIVLGAMMLASVLGNFNLLVSEFFGNDRAYGREMAMSLQDIKLSRSPNIYFILTDGYGSFGYMDANGIEIARFKSFLSNRGFRLYQEAFSNYHSTSESLPAILNMDHHYYALNHNPKSSEVRKTGRIIIGGENNLVGLLRRNSYEVQYIHNWPILLLQGCSADHCYGDMPFAGAKLVLSDLLPLERAPGLLDQVWASFMQEPKGEEDYWVERSTPLPQFGVRHSLDSSRREVIRLIEDNNSESPIFQYIHLFAPTHAPDSQVGICDEAEQIAYYSERITEVNRHLQDLVGDIISRDPSAVIVVTGDHGPYIADQCSRWTDLDTLDGYRDRMGVIMAIRWPETYDGRYDERITTTINVFKYVLAALTADDADILETLVCDDVYIHGSTDILQILADGNILIPPDHYTIKSLQSKRHEACQTNAY
jgi:hypothetical protein